jgi:tRNA A-37 threonylcarbamoyl transferase component Bud32
MTLERLKASLADRYHIERELGAGGMATVYLAEDLKHHRRVAIKVLKPELAAVLGAERFVQEIQTTAQLQHPHILPLFDSGSADGFLYYVMPYIEGETLRARLDREKQLGVEEAVKITTEVADALDYAHRHGVIHRDIKPENILLHDGRPMVADFGIALAVSAAAGGRMTETGLSLGTPHYMSPEQATAEKDITARSDVYSLASVLYEMLSGQPPHLGGSAQQIIMKIIAEPVAEVTALRKSVPPNVAAALMKALEKLPADRFESAKAFAEALDNPAFTTARAGAAGALMPAGARGFRWLMRSPWWWATIAVAAAAVALTAVVARRTAPTSTPTFTQRTFETRAIFNARFTPDGQSIVFSGMPNVGTVSRLYVIRPDHPDPAPIGPDSTNLLGVSRTGALAILTHASYVGHRVFLGTLSTVSLGGEAPHEVTTGVRDAAWAPDDTNMAVVRFRGGVDLLEYPVGTVLARSPGYFSDPRVSPTGDAVAYLEHPGKYDDRGVAVIADRAGHTVARSPIFWGLEGIAWRPDGGGILYSASGQTGDVGAGYAVRELDRSGRDRLVLSGPGNLTIQDVSRTGRLLLTNDELPDELIGRGPGAARETVMGVRDFPSLPVLSGDGRYIAFSDQSALGGPNYAALLRKTDGSPPVRLGEGYPLALSADNGSALALVPTTPLRLAVYPTGPGATRQLNMGQLQTFGYTGGLRVTGQDTIAFFCGAEAGQPGRCFIDSLPRESITPVTPPGISRGWLSPDWSSVLASDSGGFRIYPVGGGEPRPALGLRLGELPIRWSPDGREVWVVTDPDSPAALRIDRVNPMTGARSPLLNIVPGDLGGVRSLSEPTLADDPHVYAYIKFLYASRLYTVDGLR